jgi:hypothetical protein
MPETAAKSSERCIRDWLKGHPQERQHSGAAFAAGARPSAPGEAFIGSCAEDCHPQGRDNLAR